MELIFDCQDRIVISNPDMQPGIGHIAWLVLVHSLFQK
jgi:hypothetical protein